MQMIRQQCEQHSDALLDT